MTVQPLPASDLADPKSRLRFWLTMLRTTRGVENRIRDHLRHAAGTTLPRFDVLAALYRKVGGLTMSELSHSLMVSNGNVTGIIDHLVKEGLVVREKLQHDRRSNVVRLTQKGWQEFRDLAVQHEAWIEKIFEEVSTDEIEAMMKTLNKVKKNREESGK